MYRVLLLITLLYPTITHADELDKAIEKIRVDVSDNIGMLKLWGLTPATLDRIFKLAKPICQVETNCKNVINQDTKDYGYFQVNIYTLQNFIDTDKQLDMFMQDVELQVYVYVLWMSHKYNVFKGRYPKTWPCTWHSATPKFHRRYCNKLLPLIR